MRELAQVFETGPGRYGDDPAHTYGNDPAYRISQRTLATIVGMVALLLPVTMIAGAVFFGACFRQSISHFYYERVLGDVFVIGLAAIGTFLIAYRGTNPKESRLATIAGISTFCIALFPTSGPGCSADPFGGRVFAVFDPDEAGALRFIDPQSGGLQPFLPFAWSDLLHYGAAAILFGFLAWYSLVVFTRFETSGKGVAAQEPSTAKRQRNRIYNLSGSIILACMAMLSAGLFMPDTVPPIVHPLWEKWTFIFETGALWAFGFAWLTKGRFGNRMMLEDEEKMQLREMAARRSKGG